MVSLRWTNGLAGLLLILLAAGYATPLWDFELEINNVDEEAEYQADLFFWGFHERYGDPLRESPDHETWIGVGTKDLSSASSFIAANVLAIVAGTILVGWVLMQLVVVTNDPRMEILGVATMGIVTLLSFVSLILGMVGAFQFQDDLVGLFDAESQSFYGTTLVTGAGWILTFLGTLVGGLTTTLYALSVRAAYQRDVKGAAAA